MTFTELVSVFSGPAGPFTDQLRLAVTTYLARLKGTSREHTESDLCCYLFWGAPSAAGTAGRASAAPGAAHPVDAGDPPVQALHRLPGGLPAPGPGARVTG